MNFPPNRSSSGTPGGGDGELRHASTSTVATVASSLYLPLQQSCSPSPACSSGGGGGNHPDNISVRSAPAASAMGGGAKSPGTAARTSQMSLLSTPRSPRRPRPQSLYVPFQGLLLSVCIKLPARFANSFCI